jgi:hypothetical protein
MYRREREKCTYNNFFFIGRNLFHAGNKTRTGEKGKNVYKFFLFLLEQIGINLAHAVYTTRTAEKGKNVYMKKKLNVTNLAHTVYTTRTVEKGKNEHIFSTHSTYRGC